jgi:hypothetical protein
MKTSPFYARSLDVALETAHDARQRGHASTSSLWRLDRAFRDVPSEELPPISGGYTERPLPCPNIRMPFRCGVCQYQGEHYTPGPLRAMFPVRHLCPPCFQSGLSVVMTPLSLLEAARLEAVHAA